MPGTTRRSSPSPRPAAPAPAPAPRRAHPPRRAGTATTRQRGRRSAAAPPSDPATSVRPGQRSPWPPLGPDNRRVHRRRPRRRLVAVFGQCALQGVDVAVEEDDIAAGLVGFIPRLIPFGLHLPDPAPQLRHLLLRDPLTQSEDQRGGRTDDPDEEGAEAGDEFGGHGSHRATRAASTA